MWPRQNRPATRARETSRHQEIGGRNGRAGSRAATTRATGPSGAWVAPASEATSTLADGATAWLAQQAHRCSAPPQPCSGP